MRSHFSESEQAFADQVEGFIAEHWLHKADSRRRLRAWLNDDDTQGLRQQWYQAVVAAGWAVPHWPRKFGGCKWSATQLHIWFSACVRHQTPSVLNFATAYVGPLLMEFGNAQQQALLPQIARFEAGWCLGWAEPGKAVDDFELTTLIRRHQSEPSKMYVTGAKTRVVEGMQARWMLGIGRLDEKELGVFLLPLDQGGVSRTPRAALATGQPMAEIQMQKAALPAWGTLSLSTEMLRGRLSGLAQSDFTSLADSAALVDQVQRLKAQLQNENNVELGLVRDCDALAVEVLGLQAMEQRIIQSNSENSSNDLPPTAVRLRAQSLWSKLSELQIAAFGYYALPFVDGALSDNEGPIDPRRSSGDMDMTMVMRRMLSPTIATELALDPRDALAQEHDQ